MRTEPIRGWMSAATLVFGAGLLSAPIACSSEDQGFPDATDGSYRAGWSSLLSVDDCPTQFLPWLGQWVGVYVPPGTADATRTAAVANP